MAHGMPLSTTADPRRINLRDEVLGHLRRQFIGDYRFLRKAGASREKALTLCLQRYGRHKGN